MSEKVELTQKGFEDLQIEFDDLKKNKRPYWLKSMDEARAMGDLRENEAYKAARRRLEMIQGRIDDLEDILKSATIIQSSAGEEGGVQIGNTVIVKVGQLEREFHVVGEHESDISVGKISSLSPLGRELMGKHIGDSMTIDTKSGKVQYEILSIT